MVYIIRLILKNKELKLFFVSNYALGKTSLALLTKQFPLQRRNAAVLHSCNNI